MYIPFLANSFELDESSTNETAKLLPPTHQATSR